MKAHVYEREVDEKGSPHSDKSPQRRLYFPGVGVLGYGHSSSWNKTAIDFFGDAPHLIEEGEAAIKGNSAGVKYLGEIELSDELAKKVLSLGVKLMNAQRAFDSKGASLVAIVNQTYKIDR